MVSIVWRPGATTRQSHIVKSVLVGLMMMFMDLTTDPVYSHSLNSYRSIDQLWQWPSDDAVWTIFNIPARNYVVWFLCGTLVTFLLQSLCLPNDNFKWLLHEQRERPKKQLKLLFYLFLCGWFANVRENKAVQPNQFFFPIGHLFHFSL